MGIYGFVGFLKQIFITICIYLFILIIIIIITVVVVFFTGSFFMAKS